MTILKEYANKKVNLINSDIAEIPESPVYSNNPVQSLNLVILRLSSCISLEANLFWTGSGKPWN